MKIDDAIANLKIAFLAEAGLDDLAKPANPPGQLNLPAIIVYSASGGFGAGTLDEDRWGVETIVVELHVARSDLARAYADLMGYRAALVRAIFAAAATHFGDAVDAIGDVNAAGDQRPIAYVIQPDDWAGIATLALSVQIVVTTQEAARA